MRPKSVFAPYESKNGLTARTYDLPLFEDIDGARTYLLTNLRKLQTRRITWSECFDDRTINEFMATRSS